MSAESEALSSPIRFIVSPRSNSSEDSNKSKDCSNSVAFSFGDPREENSSNPRSQPNNETSSQDSIVQPLSGPSSLIVNSKTISEPEGEEAEATPSLEELIKLLAEDETSLSLLKHMKKLLSEEEAGPTLVKFMKLLAEAEKYTPIVDSEDEEPSEDQKEQSYDASLPKESVYAEELFTVDYFERAQDAPNLPIFPTK